MKRLKLKKRKGITLVEVLVSLMLLSVIAISMLTFFAGSFHSIFRQRNQNAINFDIQETFEKKMEAIKQNGGTGTEVESFTYRIGGKGSHTINVTGETLSYNDKIKKIRLFVSNAKESVLDIPEDLSVEIPNSKHYYYVGETTPKGVAGLKGEQQLNKIKIHTDLGWFLSDRSIELDGSNIVPVGTIGAAEGDTTTKAVFPKMTADFTQISKQTNGVTITDDMRGKYLTFAARAVNSYGRVGTLQEADHRIWVMGIPVTKDLLLHTDADLALLKNADGTKSNIPTDDRTHTNIDIRNYFENKLYSGTIPVLSTYETSIKQARQLIALGGNEMHFSGQNFTEGRTTSILIGNRQQTGPLLTYKLDNTLTWGINLEENGKIAIKTVDNTSANNGGQRILPITINYQTDNSIQVRSSVKNSALNIEVFINGSSVYNRTIKLTVNQVHHNINKGVISFAGNTYINEFAVYQEALNTDSITKINEYFRNKYSVK